MLRVKGELKMNRIDMRGFKVVFEEESYDAITLNITETISHGDWFTIYAIDRDGVFVTLTGHHSKFKFLRIIDD